MQYTKRSPKVELNIDIIRHIVLNSIRSYVRKFSNKYGKNLVICCDNRKYWRKDVFPFYKASRKKIRDASGFDWKTIFDSIQVLKEEFNQILPYKIVDSEGAEADDVIAALTEKYSSNENILILSSDKDFVQLQKFSGVQQYSPIMERFIGTDNPAKYVLEHIICGDRGDGIPNILHLI